MPGRTTESYTFCVNVWPSSGPGKNRGSLYPANLSRHHHRFTVYDIPEAKVVQLQERLLDWTSRRSASKHQLQELLGHLNHAAAVVRPGCAFATIETMKRPRSLHQYTRLDTQTKAEFTWWRLFVHSWNGVSILPALAPTRKIICDASGSWGCGAFQQQSGEWLQLPWPETWARMNIAVKELLPIVLAATVWGHNWAGHHILFLSDNMAVVAALNSRAARHPALSHLLKCLFFVQAFHNFEYSSSHLPGKDNTAADALSRNNTKLFLSLIPLAPQLPTLVPPHQSRCSQIPPYTGHLLAGRSCSEPLSTGARNIIQSYILLRKEQVLEVLLISQFATTQNTLCLYTAFLTQQGLATSSISLYLSALRHLEVESSCSVTDRSNWPYLQYVLREIKRSASKNLVPRLPITPDILRSLRAQWADGNRYQHILLWATACTAYFGFLRLGEVVSTSDATPPQITANAIAIDSHDNPSTVKIRVSKSKTDPFGKGTDI